MSEKVKEVTEKQKKVNEMREKGEGGDAEG